MKRSAQAARAKADQKAARSPFLKDIPEGLLNSAIGSLWQQHLDMPFPRVDFEAYGQKGPGQVYDVDLIMLDADTAGCVLHFLQNNGELDLWRVAVLGMCYGDLVNGERTLEGKALAYCTHLRHLALLVLRAVEIGAREPRQTPVPSCREKGE